jgi:hypothetical protein
VRVKRSFVIKVSIVFLVILMGYSVVDYFRESVEKMTAPEEHFPKLHNAERYFFRVGYPEDWAAEAGANNFFLDKDTGLVLNLYPLIKSSDATPIPQETGQEDVQDPMVRDETAIISFFYRPIEKGEEMDLKQAMDIALAELMESGKNITEDNISSIMDYESEKTVFKKVSYTYMKNLFPVKGDMYVAVRQMCYYIIIYEAEHDVLAGSSYNKYKDVAGEIIDDFRLSVFDY